MPSRRSPCARRPWPPRSWRYRAARVQSVVPLVIVTVPAVIEQPPVASTVTARLDVAVGVTGNVLLNAAGLVGCVNVMLCDALLAETVRTTSVAAEKFASPDCEA